MTEAKSSPSRKPNAVETVRATASKAVDVTANTALELARKTADGVEANPMAMLAAGLAAGVVAGALVPRSQQEALLLGSVGKRLNDTARGAMDAAKDTAKAEFDVLGLTRNAARDQVGKLLGDVVKALSVAGAAALTNAKAPAPTAAPVPEMSVSSKKSSPKKSKAQE